MIIPAYLPLTAYRNGYAKYDLTLTDSVTGDPLDLTNCSADMQVRRQPGASGSPYVDVNSTTPTANGSIITFTYPANGKLSILIHQLDLEPFPAVPPQGQQFAYDLLITQSGYDPAPFVKGPFNFSDGVTVEA
jgi:hypothetical protein